MTRFHGEEDPLKQLAKARRGIESLARRPATATGSASGNAIYAIEVFEALETVITGDNIFEWEIPEDLDGAVLTKIEGYLVTASSSGAVQVQIANEKAGGGVVDMLSTKLSIDVGEKNSKDAATQPVVDTANDDVVWGDHLRIDIDAAGTGATGLGVVLYFFPAATVSIAVQGAKGDPGGVVSWEGLWAGGTSYTSGQAVVNDGTSYVARTSSTGVEPGVTVGWQTYWMVLSEGKTTSSIEIVINGNGLVLDIGTKAYIEVPFNCTLYEVVLLADIAGSVVMDVWKDTLANYPPTVADSITSTSPPTISGGLTAIDSTLSGWTKAFTAGDILAFNVNSCTSITKVTISMKVLR